MRIFRAFSVLALGLAASCSQAPSPHVVRADGPDSRPARVISLDYCADQFVLKLADPEQILGVTPDATKDFSFMREKARGVRAIKSQAENIIAAGPDLVVRTYGGGANITAMMDRVGVDVAQIGYAQNLADVKANIRDVARALGHPQRGEALIADMNARLARIGHPQSQLTALYVTPSGITSGHGSMINVLIEAAGFANFEQSPGWKPIPLERLAREQPDLMVTAFFDTKIVNTDAWSPSRHPIAKRTLNTRPVAPLEGAWTACGGWFLVDAIEAMASKRDTMSSKP